MSEPPIFVQDLVYAEHFDTSSSNAIVSRNPISGSAVWIDIDQIPAAPPAPAPWPGGVTVGVVRGISGVPLGQIPGQSRQFSYEFSVPAPAPPFDHFKDVVPANYTTGTYIPILEDSEGVQVTVNPGHIAFDGISRVIEFKEDPVQQGYSPPFTLTYWQYTGRFATGESVPAIVPDVAAGSGGISVATVGSMISIGNTLTGSNLAPPVPPPTPAANVFAQKNAALLEFRSLVAGMNVTLTEDSGSIVIGAAPGGSGFSGAANLGTGPDGDIYVPSLSSTLQLRGLQAGPGLSLAMSATDIQINPDVATIVNESVPGARVYAGMTGTSAFFRCLTGLHGVSVQEAGGQITVDYPLTGSSASGATGAGHVFLQNSGGALTFRAVAAGAGVGVSQDGVDIHVSSTVTAAGIGSGHQLFYIRNPLTGDLVFNNLAEGSGISITGGAGNALLISNSMTGATVGVGDDLPYNAAIYGSTAGGVMNFRGLKAGAYVSLNIVGDDVEISAYQSVTGIDNVGSSAQPMYAISNGIISQRIQMLNLLPGPGINMAYQSDCVEISATTSNLGMYVFLRELPLGANGGGCSAGVWTARPLTTFHTQGAAVGVALSSGNFTLPAGSYLLMANSVAYRVGSHKCRIVNQTTGLPVTIGSSECSSKDSSTSHARATVSLTASATFRLEHIGQYSRPFDGFGHATGFSGSPEVYAQVVVYRFG